MEKVKVSFENILAGLIVRFGKANVTDIKVIQDINGKSCRVIGKLTIPKLNMFVTNPADDKASAL